MKRKAKEKIRNEVNGVKIKKARLLYTREIVETAKEEVKRGCSVLSVAAKYSIPEATLRAKMKNKYPEKPPGPAPVLSIEEEKELESWILDCGSKGFPVTKNQLLDSVKKICDEMKKKTPFINNRPGRKWFQSYLIRHPEISKRVPENLNLNRAKVSEESLKKWFQEVKSYLESNNLLKITGNRIFNCDETGVSMNPKPSSVLFKKGAKNCLRITGNNEKENVSILFTGNAVGDLAPPFILYSGKSLPLHAAECSPKDFALGYSDNGYMTSKNFYEYIANRFEPYLTEKNIQRPVVLYLDGHASHLTLHLSKFCLERQIILIALHPNATHLIQPFDVSYFSTFKQKWQEAHEEFCKVSCVVTIKRYQIAAVLQLAIKKIKNEQLLKNGFRKCGLFPFDVENVDFTKLIIRDTNVNAVSSSHSSESLPTTLDKLKIIESTLSEDQLESFKMNKSSTWYGLREDTNLFLIWYRLAHANEYNILQNIQNVQEELRRDSVVSADGEVCDYFLD